MSDAIIVLAGGVNDDGSLPDVPKRRVEEGVKAWKENKAPKIIMSGAYGFWFDWLKKVPQHLEADAMKEYAEHLGVPSDAILLEKDSKDTVGNAYFTKVNFLEKNNWKNVIVVTSDFHMERTKIIFDLVLGPEYKIEYISASGNLTPEKAIEWKASEEKTISVLKEIMGDIQVGDTEGIKHALFTRHPGYAENPEFSFEKLKEMLGRDVRSA